MNWVNFAIVLVCAVAISAVIGVLYAYGVRLLAVARDDVEGVHHMRSRIGAATCFGLCAAIVLFALWLIVPFFH